MVPLPLVPDGPVTRLNMVYDGDNDIYRVSIRVVWGFDEEGSLVRFCVRRPGAAEKGCANLPTESGSPTIYLAHVLLVRNILSAISQRPHTSYRKRNTWTAELKAEAVRRLCTLQGGAKEPPIHQTVEDLKRHDVSKWRTLNGSMLSKWNKQMLAADAAEEDEYELGEGAATHEHKRGKSGPGRPVLVPPELRGRIRAVIRRYLATGLEGNSTARRPVIVDEIEAAGYGNILSENRGSFDVSTSWINKLCQKMELPMRDQTSGAKPLPADWEQQLERFAHRLAYLVFTHDIPKDLIIGFDQTGVRLVPNTGRGRAPKGAKHVSFVGSDDKRQFTCIPGFMGTTMLPWQVVLKGTTERCLPPASCRLKHEVIISFYLAGTACSLGHLSLVRVHLNNSFFNSTAGRCTSRPSSARG